ncbi:MAG: hypothetical protein CM1200mP30_17220 [Pseudomonadota bacterium]|nr:MAG: hypothetical protein CM1200mP30_17220 [Pseudomonadota bacterium]
MARGFGGASFINSSISVPACTSVGIFGFCRKFQSVSLASAYEQLRYSENPPCRDCPIRPSTTMGSTEITDYYGMGAAAATLLAIPSMIVFLILQRFFISNTMTSGMKL